MEKIILKRKPKIFYKYKPIDKYLFELLKENKFYYSNANELNDFFDLRFRLTGDLIKQLMLKTYEENKNQSEQLKTISKIDIDKRINNLISDPNAMHLYHEKLYTKLEAKICCFTRNQFSSSMWTFYAKNHEGVILEFDFSKDEVLHSLISKVHYLKHINPIDDISKITNSCIAKMPEWSREREWRIIIFGHNKGIFNKDCLKSITFGMKVKPRNISTVMDIVKKNGYNNVKFFQLIWFQNTVQKLEWKE